MGPLQLSQHNNFDENRHVCAKRNVTPIEISWEVRFPVCNKKRSDSFRWNSSLENRMFTLIICRSCIRQKIGHCALGIKAMVLTVDNHDKILYMKLYYRTLHIYWDIGVSKYLNPHKSPPQLTFWFKPNATMNYHDSRWQQILIFYGKLVLLSWKL